MKFTLALTALLSGVAAFTPAANVRTPTVLANGPAIGAGGMADTRDPDAYADDDARKSISAAPSFEEYMKQRAGGGAPAPVAAAPAPAAPAAYGAAPAYAPAPAAAPAAYGAAPSYGAAPAMGGGGDIMGTLSSLEGPGVVWGAEGVMAGKEESELKCLDNFDKFFSALQSTGVAQELAGAGPFTVFAPTNSAMETYEKVRGPIDANVVKMQIVPGQALKTDAIRGDMQSLAGPLKYRYAVRKHFVNDAIIGEKSFGPYPDFPVDVSCSNGMIHAVGSCFAIY